MLLAQELSEELCQLCEVPGKSPQFINYQHEKSELQYVGGSAHVAEVFPGSAWIPLPSMAWPTKVSFVF